jgi:hypothetical protein
MVRGGMYGALGGGGKISTDRDAANGRRARVSSMTI